MGRKNHRRRRPQAQRKFDGTAGVRTPPPPPLEHMVIPTGRCHYPHRKMKFSQEDVDKALRQVRARRERQGLAYTEERYYLCEADRGGCGAYHLTSRTTYTPRSSQ